MTRLAIGIMATTLAVTGLTGDVAARGSEKGPDRDPNSAEFHEGEVFPTIVFPSLEGGRPGSVADFRGQKLILQIFASW